MRCLSCLTARNSWLSAALAAAAVLTLSACSDHIAAPIEFGTLRVNVVTDGEDKGPTYMLTLGDDPQISIGVNGSVLLHQIPVGSHEIQLSGLRSNCSTTNATVTVEVLKESIVATEFRITCVARNGSIMVSTVTTGSGLDPDGYVILLDGQESLPAPSSSQVMLPAIREGSHRIQLTGLASNCTGGGEVTRTVSFGAVISIQFAIVCTLVVAGTGTISGVILDADTHEPVVSIAWVRISASTSSPPPPQTIPLNQPFALYKSDGSFDFGLLSAGRWTISVSAIHRYTPIFSGLNLYADTTLTVDVVAGQTTMMPTLLLRPRTPLLLVGISTCPGGLPDPPTQNDWDNCDGGYWGGVNVDVGIVVNGVAGTATAGVHLAATIRPYGAKPHSFAWDDNFWSAPFEIAIPGDYDVSIGPLLPAPRGGTWRLLPWETAVRRITMDRVVNLVQFGFWLK